MKKRALGRSGLEVSALGFGCMGSITRIIATALVLAFAAPGIAHAQDSLTVVRGTRPTNPAPAENFTGTVRVGNPFQAQAPARVYGATVAFEPGAPDPLARPPPRPDPRGHGRHRTSAALGRPGPGDPAG